ncbi:MAG: hypothetical protein JWR52_3198 [Marmoricola sp.]|nr:hypothetical protein [Marmoricola sp.]
MGLVAQIAALVPVLTPSELEAFVRGLAIAQGLSVKVIDGEVIATVTALIGTSVRARKRPREKP